MNKRTIRAFAFGIIFSVCLVGLVYSFSNDGKKNHVTVAEAKEVLSKKGYEILSEKEYAAVLNQSKNDASENAKTETTKNKEDSTAKNTDSEKKEDNKETIYSYNLKITSGMSVDEMATFLKNANIIKDEKGFSQFLIKKGYHQKVQLGTFKLTSKMNYDQIAKVITKNR